MAPGAGGMVPADFLVGASVAVLLAGFILVALRRELGLPFTIGLLVVPVVVGLGFALALAIHVWLAVSLLNAAGILSGLLIASIALYEGLRQWNMGPPPPMGRY